MAVKLVSMRGMHDDEIVEIRELLDKNNLAFYETPPGAWGISAAIFWLYDDEELEEAKRLLESYQQQRGERIRQEYAEQKQAGEHTTFWQMLIHHPVRFLVYTGFALFILYVSVMPFLDLADH